MRNTDYNTLDRDPVIDEVLGMIWESGESFSAVAAKSHVSVTTMRSWWSGKTSKPRFSTVNAIALALGYRHQWTDRNGRPIRTSRLPSRPHPDQHAGDWP